MTTFTKYLIYDPDTKTYLRAEVPADLKWSPQIKRGSSFLFKMDALLNLRLARFDRPGAGIIAAEFTVNVERTIKAVPRLIQDDRSFDSARKKLDDHLGFPRYHV